MFEESFFCRIDLTPGVGNKILSTNSPYFLPWHCITGLNFSSPSALRPQRGSLIVARGVRSCIPMVSVLSVQLVFIKLLHEGAIASSEPYHCLLHPHPDARRSLTRFSQRFTRSYFAARRPAERMSQASEPESVCMPVLATVFKSSGNQRPKVTSPMIGLPDTKSCW